jgi:hypothetical protein
LLTKIQRGRKKGAIRHEVGKAREGTVILFGDSTLLREFPPLRACWAKVGEQAQGPITGNNARRALFATLNPRTGHLVRAVLPERRAKVKGVLGDGGYDTHDNFNFLATEGIEPGIKVLKDSDPNYGGAREEVRAYLRDQGGRTR